MIVTCRSRQAAGRAVSGRRAALMMAAAVAAGAAAPALAQEAQSAPGPEATAPLEGAQGGSGGISYPPSFFDQFRPTNANDMVNRIPGFTVNSGDDVRGFAGAVGNVLIDGQRPSSKSVNVGQYLQRIPVAQVERIDLIRGSAPGIDMQGQPVVVNIIRKKGATAGGAVQAMVKPFPQDKFTGFIPRVELNWRQGPWSVEWQANARQDQNFDSGEGQLVRWRSNGQTQVGDFLSRSEMHYLNSNGAIEYQGLGGVVRLNGGLDRQDTDRREYAEAPFHERSQVKARKDKAELGGDYQRNFTDWLSGQLIAVKTWTDDRQVSFNQSPINNQQATEDSLGGESILRGTLSAVRSEELRFDTGIEGAFNFLDATSGVIQNGVPVPIPAANIRVEEKRAEGFGTVNWKPNARFGAEAGLRWEVSNISSVSGPIAQEKNLSFPKPRLILSYAPDNQSQVRLRLERTVGQLNFKDFAATTQLEAGTVTAGNPDIVPERAWLAELALERRFWSRGAIVVTLSHADVAQVVDLVPVDGRFDAPGNIGDGIRQELKVNLTLPLDRLGISGGLIRMTSTWRRSEVTDPVTGQTRRISNQRDWEGDFHISKAFPKWKSVAAIEAGQWFEETGYRINEIRSTQDTPLWKFWWDYNPRPDLIFRFQYENFNGKERVRQRTVFSGPRSGGVVNFSERRYAVLKPFFMFRARKTF